MVGTPHLGASTFEASKRVGQEVVAEVIAGLRGEIVKNAVNIPTLSEESFVKLQAFIHLAEQMGILYRQIRRQASSGWRSSSRARRSTSPRTPRSSLWWRSRASSKDSMAAGNVNFVNANFLAEQIGIEVTRDHIPRERRLPQSHPHDRHRRRRHGVRRSPAPCSSASTRASSRSATYTIIVHPRGQAGVRAAQNVPGVIGRVGPPWANSA